MASNSQILEGLWGLGVPQATIAGAPTDADFGTFTNDLRRRGITDDQISKAQQLADWRPDKKKNLRDNITSILKVMGVDPKVLAEPDPSRTPTEEEILAGVTSALGGQIGTNLHIKLGMGSTIPQGQPVWNPFRGDQPPAPPPGAAPAAGAPAAAPTPAPAAAPSVPMTEPKTRGEVAALQTALNAKGAGLTVDGIMGPRTRAAWQKQGGPGAPAPGATPPAGAGALAKTAPATTPTPQIGVGPGASLEDQKAYVRGHYGYLAGWLDDPEVGPVLEQAAREGWDMSRLEGGLSTTNWWKTHDATQRQKQNEQKTDPATYGAGVAGKRTEIQAEAGRQGVTVDPGRLDQMAADAYTNGWKPNEVTQNVAAEFHYDPKAAKQPGEVGNLKSIASSYLIPIDDSTIQQWAGDIMAGRSNDAAFTEYIKGQAKTLFPTMSAAIDSGQTVAQYVAPYRSTIAQTLELDPNTIDFMEPKYMRLLTTIDPKTNAPVAKPLYQTMDDVRKDPIYGFQYTSGAKDQAASFSQKLAQTWGLS